MSAGMTRREFLQYSGAGLTLAVAFSPFGLRLAGRRRRPAADFRPNAWLTVHPDGGVTIVVAKSEMGQGVYTSMPMIVADELEADWKRVAIEVAPARDEYKDPSFGMQATGGSTSVRHMYEPLRKAGAAARFMLVAAAAKRWGAAGASARPRAASSPTRRASARRPTASCPPRPR